MRRLIRLFDGRMIDTTDMTQAQELAHLRKTLGKHYAQRVVGVEYQMAPTPHQQPQETTADEPGR